MLGSRIGKLGNRWIITVPEKYIIFFFFTGLVNRLGDVRSRVAGWISEIITRTNIRHAITVKHVHLVSCSFYHGQLSVTNGSFDLIKIRDWRSYKVTNDTLDSTVVDKYPNA